VNILVNILVESIFLVTRYHTEVNYSLHLFISKKKNHGYLKEREGTSIVSAI